MRASDVYERYVTPKNLQEHHLRVAALAEIIVTNWTGPEIAKQAVVTACLFHDLAKAMSLDISKQAAYGMTPIEIQKLDKLQQELFAKYGKEEHHAVVEIVKELGCSELVVTLVNDLEWKYIPEFLKQNKTQSLIPIYCDMRIGPNGILSIEERQLDIFKRTNQDTYKEDTKNGQLLENLLQTYISIDLKTISDEQLNSRFKGLLDQEI